MRLVLAFALASATALAQDKPQKIDPRWFLPRDHERLAVVDFVALRESELWESARTSVLGILVRQMESEFGVSFDRLDRLTVVWMPPSEVASAESVPSSSAVAVFEGNAPLGDPATLCESWQKDRIGDRDVYSRGDWFREMRLWPRPDLRVEGSPSVLEPLLQQPPQPGLPCSDLLSLLAGREKPIAFVAGSVVAIDGAEVLQDLLPGTQWQEGRAPTSFALRLLLTRPEGADEPRTCVHLTIRHASVDQGIDVTQQAVEALLGKARKDKRLAMVHKVLRTAAVTRDGIDLHVRFDCGRERDAVGLLSSALAFGGIAFTVDRGLRQEAAPMPVGPALEIVEEQPEGQPVPGERGGEAPKPDAPRGGGR